MARDCVSHNYSTPYHAISITSISSITLYSVAKFVIQIYATGTQLT